MIPLSEQTPSEADQDDILELTPTQWMLGIAVGLLVAYTSLAVVGFFQLPESRRTISNLVFPFGFNETATSLHKKGVKHYRSHDYRKAIAAFERSLKRHGENVKGVFLLGSSLIRMGRFEEGLQLLESAQKLDPSFSRIFAKRAYVLLGLGYYDRAVNDADRYVARTDVNDANRIYGYLIKVAAGQMSGDADPREIDRLVTEAHDLSVPESSLPVNLVKLLAGNISIDRLLDTNLTRGQETEVKVWGAVRATVDGRTDRARELIQWVLQRGDQDRYEYDLAVALSDSSYATSGS